MKAKVIINKQSKIVRHWRNAIKEDIQANGKEFVAPERLFYGPRSKTAFMNILIFVPNPHETPTEDIEFEEVTNLLPEPVNPKP